MTGDDWKQHYDAADGTIVAAADPARLGRRVRIYTPKQEEPGMNFSAQQKLDAVERELKLRRHVYPNRVMTGRMTDSFAELQLAIFENIADDYRRESEKERLL
jgi:hypothetical protein